MQDAGFPGFGEEGAAYTHSPTFAPKMVERRRKQARTAVGLLFLARSLLEARDMARAEASEAVAIRSKDRTDRRIRTPWTK